MQSTGVPLRVCMLGSGNVGKSALTLQFMYDEFVEDYEPTKCSAYKKQMNLDGYLVNLDITDTAGQEDYVGIQDQYYRFNDGFLVVFSLCDMETLKSVPAILERIVQCRTPERIPIVLVGNKADLVHERTVPYATAKLLADQWQIPYMETSAKTRFNLEDTYGILIRALLHNKLGACRQPTEQVSSGGSGCCVVLWTNSAVDYLPPLPPTPYPRGHIIGLTITNRSVNESNNPILTGLPYEQSYWPVLQSVLVNIFLHFAAVKTTPDFRAF